MCTEGLYRYGAGNPDFDLRYSTEEHDRPFGCRHLCSRFDGWCGCRSCELPAGNYLPGSMLLAFSTGTSWGTFGILIPIVVAIFPAGSEMLIIGMSACLAGAVCGDHCSPISDTTIMSSAGAECNHLNHVSTQMPYAIFVAAISFVAYLVAGFVQNWMIVLPIAIVVMIAIMFVIKAATKKAA